MPVLSIECQCRPANGLKMSVCAMIAANSYLNIPTPCQVCPKYDLSQSENFINKCICVYVYADQEEQTTNDNTTNSQNHTAGSSNADATAAAHEETDVTVRKCGETLYNTISNVASVALECTKGKDGWMVT